MKTGILSSATMIRVSLCAIALCCASVVCAADDAKLSRVVTHTSTTAIPLQFSWASGTNTISGVSPANATVQRIDIQLMGYCTFGNELYFYLADAAGDHSYQIDTSN